jgi:hypothetical protein
MGVWGPGSVRWICGRLVRRFTVIRCSWLSWSSSDPAHPISLLGIYILASELEMSVRAVGSNHECLCARIQVSLGSFDLDFDLDFSPLPVPPIFSLFSCLSTLAISLTI